MLRAARRTGPAIHHCRWATQVLGDLMRTPPNAITGLAAWVFIVGGVYAFAARPAPTTLSAAVQVRACASRLPLGQRGACGLTACLGENSCRGCSRAWSSTEPMR